MTRYEKLLEKRLGLEKEKETLQGQMKKENQEAASALLSEGRMVPLQNDFSRRIEVIDLALESLNSDLQAAESEQIKLALTELDKKTSQLTGEYHKAYEKCETAKRTYYAVETEFGIARAFFYDAHEQLQQEKQQLQERLNELEPVSTEAL